MIRKLTSLLTKETRSLMREFITFAVVGCFSFVVNYGTFAVAMTIFGVSYMLSSPLGYIAGIFVSYFGNKIFTFVTERKFKRKEFAVYLSVYTFSLVVSLLLLRFFVDILKLSPFIANVVVIGISTVTNFVGVKIFLFKTVMVP